MGITGLWSADIFYYDDFQSNILCFENDGKGFFCYSRPDYKEIDTFEWLLESGKVNISGIESIITEREVIRERKKSNLLQRLDILLGEQNILSSKLVKTIEFSDEIDFGETKYGLIERDFSLKKLYQDLKMIIND